MDPLAYVVILNWNRREYLRDCLRAAFDQTYARFRVIVVDNGSTDGSAALVRDEFPEARLVELPENLHFARGSNAGFEAAMQDRECAHVVALNNDTRVDPEWLSELVRAARDPRIGTASSKLLFMDRPKVINSAGICATRDGAGVDRGWNEADEGQFDEAVDVFGPSGGAALYRREALGTVGIYDPDFVAYYEDLDLAWRIRLAGWEARFAPRSVVYHKYSGSSSPRAIWKTYQGERNRIWNLVQNYPMRYVLAGIPWNATRIMAAVLRRSTGWRPPAHQDSPTFSEYADAVIRARLDAYAGLRRAFAKRRQRATYRRVDAPTVGQWLKKYGVPVKDMPAD